MINNLPRFQIAEIFHQNGRHIWELILMIILLDLIMKTVYTPPPMKYKSKLVPLEIVDPVAKLDPAGEMWSWFLTNFCIEPQKSGGLVMRKFKVSAGKKFAYP